MFIYLAFDGDNGVTRREVFHNIDELNMDSIRDILIEAYEVDLDDTEALSNIDTELEGWIIEEDNASVVYEDGEGAAVITRVTVF